MTPFLFIQIILPTRRSNYQPRSLEEMVDQPAQHAIKNEPEPYGAILKRLAERASRYSINLDGFISKDNAPCSRGGFALIWPGTLQLQKAKAVVAGLANNDFLGDGETAKVSLLLSLNTLPYREPRLL